MKIRRAARLLPVVCLAISLSAPGQQRSRAGEFDYYLLNLSWSPEFCHGQPNSPECSGSQHFGFIVHGLWPQFRNGGGPEYCGQQPGLSDPARMLDIMPDVHLVAHEWAAHGTCSGLNADDYFGLIRRIFTALRMPPEFVSPARQFNIPPAELKRSFEQANPGLADADLAVSCAGPYLRAIEVCMSKDGRPMPCTAVRDCRTSILRVPRVR
ncbi:MAG TPA: ribonuclease T2 [Bryobacteraceae bacterium]|jgi:ribonuclease T2